MRLIDADALELEYRRQFESVYKHTRDSVIPSDYYVERKAAYDKELVRRDMEAFCEFLRTRPTVNTETMRWISIEEQLPEYGDVVLVIANGKPMPNITLHDAFLIASYWGAEGWLADGFNGWDALNVSYWLELPKSPKEEWYEQHFDW